MKKIFSLFLLALMLVTTGMFRANNAAAQAGFDRHTMLQGLVDHVILPGYQNFVDAASELERANTALSANPGIENLASAQAAWRNASNTWEEIAFMSINIDLMSLHNQVDKRPINESLLLRRVERAEVLDEAFVASLGSNQKGLPTIEYFLFDPTLSQEQLLQTLLADETALPLLVALSQSLHSTARDLYDYWSPVGQNYAADFIAADQAGGDAQSTINIIVNELFGTFSMILDMRLGRPAGLVEGSEPRPDLDDAARSGQALSRIEHNLIGMQRLFNGGIAPDQSGFDDYLNFLGAEYESEPLSDLINARFDAAIAAVQAIETPLYQAVIDEPEAVAAAYTAIQNLYIPIRVDMSSQLSILVTFSDQDGDS